MHTGYNRRKTIFSLLVAMISCFMFCANANSSVTTNNFPSFHAVMASDVVYVEMRYFVWEEFYEGQKLVTESGFIPAIGIRGFLGKINNSVGLTYEAVVFYGMVDYEGYLQSGDALIPYTSDTSYLGLEGNCSAVVNIETKEFIIAPFVGLRYSCWLRALGTDSFIRDPYGYDEYWQTLHGITGIQYKIPSSKTTPVIITISASLLFPLFVDETVDLSNADGPSEIKLDPEGKSSFEIGMEMDVPFRNVSSRMIFGIFYRTIEFSESSLDKTYQTFFQPESHYRIVGLKVGFNF
jgi:hypothetical protein